MKTLAIALSVATLFAAAASAQETSEYSGYNGFVSTKTRAEVQAEVRVAQQRGELRDGEQYPALFTAPAPAAKSRAEVKAELVAYRKTHPEVSADVSVVQ